MSASARWPHRRLVCVHFVDIACEKVAQTCFDVVERVVRVAATGVQW